MAGPFLESLQVLPRIVTRLRKPSLQSLGSQDQGLCHACGAMSQFAAKEILPTALAVEWRLTPAMKAAFDQRESRACPACNNNFRNRQLARALVEIYGKSGEASLAELLRTERFRSLRILGIDMEFLRMLDDSPGFVRSDYVTSLVPARGTPDRDMPFDDNSFDIVLLSDTLEHISTYRRALREIRRVLRPGGRFVTAQPVILSRRSVTRCVVDETGQLKHLLPPSLHVRGADDSLVFVEFGIDFIDDVKAAGLQPHLYFYNLPADDHAWVAVCKKPT